MKVSQNSFSRKKPDQLVYLELGSGNGGMLLSLDEDGFRFRAVSPLRPEGQVPFAFSLDGKARIQGVGELEWLEDDGKSGGMRFVEISPEFRAAIDHWLAVDSSRAKSEREVTPAAATPLDTMEKIREELRRGYPQRPASEHSSRQESEAQSEVQASKPEGFPKKFSPRSSISEPSAVSQPSANVAAPVSSSPEQPGTAENDSSPEVAATQETPQEVGKQEATSPSDAQAPSPQHDRKPKPPFREAGSKTPVPSSRAFRTSSPNRPASAERLPKQQSPAAEPPSEHKPGRDRSPAAPAKPFYPPPFQHRAEPEQPAERSSANSAFVKKPIPAQAQSYAPASEPAESKTDRAGFGAPQHTPPAPEPEQPRAQAHASSDSLRRPFRAETLLRNPERPYIPPVDESFEAAWERAKLTAPPESPHLSRAAAGSIIGVALAVILGALAFNFRQDIGELVISAGEKISGQSHTASPVPPAAAAEKQTESQPATSSDSPESSATPNKPADNAGSQPAASRSAGSNPVETRAGDGASQQRPSTTTAAREANSAASRNPASEGSATGAAGGGRGPSGNENASSANGATSAPAAPQVPAGTVVTTIGTEAGGGMEEFNAAREMLKGDHRHRDLSSAVNLLWAGVRKGYVPAEVTLADLYRRGDGVEKNCDQAQVLLVAASKKGSPEARQMLELMAEQGCTE